MLSLDTKNLKNREAQKTGSPGCKGIYRRKNNEINHAWNRKRSGNRMLQYMFRPQ